jgi:hypothetical protein
MLSSCSLVGSAAAGGGVAVAEAIVLVTLLLLLILAGSCGAGALFTILPSFSTLRWSRGGGTGFVAAAIGVVAVPFTPLCCNKNRPSPPPRPQAFVVLVGLISWPHALYLRRILRRCLFALDEVVRDVDGALLVHVDGALLGVEGHAHETVITYL